MAKRTPKIIFKKTKCMKQILHKIGVESVKKARANMATVSYGRMYHHSKLGWVLGSAVGEPANNQTGDLSNTIRYTTRGKVLTLSAGNSQVDYASYLEDPSILNRPNLTTVYNDILQEKQLNEDIEKLIFKHIKIKK